MATLFPQLEQDNARDASQLSARLHRAGHWSSDPQAIQAKVAELSASSRALLAEVAGHDEAALQAVGVDLAVARSTGRLP
jgi:hypothetical protein